jgi:hypothetical protein
MVTVTYFWWHDAKAKCRNIYEYTPDHVRVLRDMVEKNLSLPHKFVVVTDRPDKIPDLSTIPLDKTTFIPGTRFAKLMMFRRDIGSVIGERILYLDLDCVVTGSLDPLVGRHEDLVLWRNPNFGAKRRARYNTSIMLIKAGCRPELYENFNPEIHPAKLRKAWGGTDQAWLSVKCSPDEAHWTSKDGIYNVGRLSNIVPGVGTELPENARIVFFPGAHEPSMKSVKEKHPWITRYRP